ncbi:Predicted amidophosphoribosyltransferases [Haloechinothrix alba]|uniref:Predicted amidophosphoribosyltransferases n=1 Tax=Haloechinothrix alba TaxID=664784 RepID=A0A238VCX6_9PSEU|nr:ComF family protein [Haloechinothrix alba]SNR31897.1 Predicted amidophosphoribosyltransferases [Haloechinothrix alba]
MGDPLPSLRRAATAALDLVLPASCAGCGRYGEPCCSRCRPALLVPAPLAGEPGRRVTSGSGVPAYALAGYRGVPRRILLAYKEGGRRDLAPVLGEVLAEACVALALTGDREGGTLRLVPAPSRSSAARARGGGHVLRLARHAAAVLDRGGHPASLAPVLRLGPGALDSVGLDRAQRTANVTGRISVAGAWRCAAGDRVVLVDDVVTTGATAAACVRALRDAGACDVAVLGMTAIGH